MDEEIFLSQSSQGTQRKNIWLFVTVQKSEVRSQNPEWKRYIPPVTH